VLKYHIVAINGNESVRMVINIPPERIYVVFLMAGYSESGQWLFIYKFMNENSSAAEFTFPVKFFLNICVMFIEGTSAVPGLTLFLSGSCFVSG
ncbi:TPA: hypothetical protein ACGBJ5_005126, partial [Escherichia coli]